MTQWNEIDWLTVAELAEVCGTDTFALRGMLEAVGLAEGFEPSPLAVRHGFVEPSTEEAGRTSFLWHRDASVILRGLAREPAGEVDEDRTLPDELGVNPEPREFQTDMFELDEEALEAELAGEEAGIPDRRTESAEARLGAIRPGFDAIVATDGACSGNPGPGGWAWVEQITGARDSGGAAHTTNNIMELTALVEALRHVGPSGDLLIRIDSQYVINTVTKWAPSWRRKGWKKANGEPVANRELVERLLALYEARMGRTEVEWVKGHSGDEANELVDRLAVARSREFAKAAR